MAALALCERRDPDQASDHQVRLPGLLGTPKDDMTIHVSPWSDPVGAGAPTRIDLSITPESHKELFDEPGSRLPA
jgi:hypothetical protein